MEPTKQTPSIVMMGVLDSMWFSMCLGKHWDLDRITEAYMDVRTLAVFMFAPFVTILVAPILVLRYSSLSIVDKNTRSMSPIGRKSKRVYQCNYGRRFGSTFLPNRTEHRKSIDRQWRFYAVIAIHWFHFIPDSFLGVLFLSTCLASYA